MGWIILSCIIAIICCLAVSFFIGMMMELGFDWHSFVYSILYIVVIVLLIIGAYFDGLHTNTYYCKNCNYHTTSEEIQYCPNDGQKLEIYVYER